MFLKRIEMQGFKSFPDETVIEFNQDVTGIVGPNGTGKSNITDAFRWVLGEQSAKSMRGFSMSDVIFAGSSARKAVNCASVTLVFDNQSRLLNYDCEEVEITRKIYRNLGEGEYYINKQPVRLKDITDLILDTGLGKDSLSIISQGTISSFAEAKPLERRSLFEEAAGVSKYKKRKVEALGKLNRTQDNIERMMDIVSELEKQVVPLKKASDKAKIYEEKQNELKTIEVSVLVYNISSIKNELTVLAETLFNMQSEKVSLEANLNLNENKQAQIREQISLTEMHIHQTQDALMELLAIISQLEAQKTQLEEKSKYVLEVGNLQEKINELSSLVVQAKHELDDRQQRYQQTKVEIDLIEQEKLDLNMQMVDVNQLLSQKQSQYESYQKALSLQQQLVERPYAHHAGVQAVLNNKMYLSGILDVVVNLLTPLEGYEVAIATALASSGNYVVTKDEEAAKEAVTFLKNNRSGRATFIPLSVIKPKILYTDQLILAKSVDGYLGTADQFVNYVPSLNTLALNLLGNVLIAQDLSCGSQLAKRLGYRLKVVTLEGDVFHVGGNITGGSMKENTSVLLAKKEIKRIEMLISSLQEEISKASALRDSKQMKGNQLSNQLMNARLELAKLEPILEVKKSKYDKLVADLKLLTPQEADPQEFKHDLISQLNEKYQQKDRLMTKLSGWRLEQVELNQQNSQLSQSNSQLRKQIQTIVGHQNTLNIKQAKLETMIENDLNRLGSLYQMTYEFANDKVISNLDIEQAKQQVAQLRQEITRLGAINMNAPAEYEEVNQRYEFLSTQLSQLQTSKQEMLAFIDEMDELMVTQFKEMFDLINQEFDGVFKALFNGGKAKLILENPDDLLNTGIDIDVSPPGKSIQNIRLFSGGEKSLIAISVLFAMMKARQMPLCIFDEVEAALDQANVERFAKYIRQYTHNTQFVIVTHRPGTMSQCDVLFGITMASQGISNILRVQLADATKMAREGV